MSLLSSLPSSQWHLSDDNDNSNDDNYNDNSNDDNYNGGGDDDNIAIVVVTVVVVSSSSVALRVDEC